MAPWWRGASVYQVYVRSFADSNGDGQGDLPGLIARLDYIRDLGIDAIWLSPIHPSPNRDWGYDVSDYAGVHPDYGTLADFDALLAAAHERGIRVLLDEVLAHTSDEHAWFAGARDGDPALRDFFVWADPKPDGTAPNNWLSAFGGAAWAYAPSRRQYYHHKFLRQQPKLNWRHAPARDAALGVLDQWLSRGADGFRLDVANAYLHDATLADNPPLPDALRDAAAWSHAANLQRHWHDANLPDNIALLDTARRAVEKHDGRFVFGEFSEDAERAGGFLPPDRGLHASYTFELITADALSPAPVRAWLETLARYPDHWPCVSFSNHDVVRTVSRFGGKQDGDPALAKLYLTLLASLRGTMLLYQGEELGLPQVDLRRDQLRDPVGDLYYPVAKGRDGCRTPMPWDDAKPNLGFSTGTPWLPPGPAHAPLSVTRQSADPASTLSCARALMAVRRASPALRQGSLTLLDAPDPLLAFIRHEGDQRLVCVFNLSRETAAWAAAPKTGTPLIAAGTHKMEQGRLTLGPLSALIAAA